MKTKLLKKGSPLKSITVALFFSCAAALPAAAESESFTLDPNHTFASFEYKHFGLSTQRGRFTKLTGKATVDTAAKTGNLDVVIDASSIDVGPPPPFGAPAQPRFLRRREVSERHLQEHVLHLRR
jgi:polyisoprenoid-binding protein YceI